MINIVELIKLFKSCWNKLLLSWIFSGLLKLVIWINISSNNQNLWKSGLYLRKSIYPWNKCDRNDLNDHRLKYQNNWLTKAFSSKLFRMKIYQEPIDSLINSFVLIPLKDVAVFWQTMRFTCGQSHMMTNSSLHLNL